ncbi:cytochrome P450 [Amniculicola lignicola CBS 123094]|uniref:Cytochrome P450 n=1 Tax=Amniculicola lignicola CBS 123094 TaxID=1392246 RepID=A0A6A5X5G1_9PLEO|nr:cytochrome P450 [Amniculicola lignicola CBS 123094]
MAERMGGCISCSPGSREFALHRTAPLLNTATNTWMGSSYVIKGASAGIALSLLVVLYALYNIFLHPLRQYPGPLLWRAFRIPWVISIHKGNVHRRMKEFHDKYGPVVRIAPNELSYTDGRAWKDIYLNRADLPVFPRNPASVKKTDSPSDPQNIMGPDEDAHARLRRAFAHSFSDKSLRDQAPTVEGYVDAFIKQINPGAKKTSRIELVTWLNYVSFDISGDLSFGESFDCIKNAQAHPWVEISKDFGKGLALVASINQYPPLDKYLGYILPKNIVQRRLDHRAMSAAKARKRLEMDTDRPDFVTPTKKYNDQKDALSLAEWELNMSTLVFAGSETTWSALSGIMRELLQNRGVLHRLTREIRSAFGEEDEITIASAGKLAYLNAVIGEGLRLAPPVVIGLPRVVPEMGATVCGQWVPGGTYVAVHQFAANRQASNFHLPNSFIPERFLEKDDRDDMSILQPFNIGRHSCIGMKLAYAEMRLILARLLYAFDVVLDDPTDVWDWGEQDTFMFWDKRPLWVKVERAGGV